MATVTGNIDVVTTGTNVGVAVTQNGTGNILNLYDGSNLRFYVNQYGNPTVTSGNPVIASTNSSSSVTTTLFSNSSGQGVLQTNSGHSLTLGTGGVEKLRITGNGHVNIGGDYTQTTYKFKVTGTSYFDGNLTATGADINGDIDVDGHTNLDNVSIAGITTFSSGMFIPDNQVIHLGNVAGTGDLQIYHDTSHSYVKDVGTGDLVLQTQGGHVRIKYGSDTMALFQPSGYSQLYFNNNVKLATTSDGITVTRNTSDTTMTNTSQLVLRNTNDGANTFAGIRFEVSSNSNTDHYIVQKKHSGGSGTDLIVGHGSNERIRFIESGGITFNGDTSSNNALDDYEEGTAFSSTGNATIYQAAYTKVGRLVTISFRASVTSGNTQALSLPFVHAGNAGDHILGVVKTASTFKEIILDSSSSFTLTAGFSKGTLTYPTNS